MPKRKSVSAAKAGVTSFFRKRMMKQQKETTPQDRLLLNKTSIP